MKKLSTAVLVAVLLVALTAAVSANGTTETAQTDAVWQDPNPDPYSAMPFPVTFTTGRHLPLEMKLPDGQTLEDNHFTRWVEENLNVSADVVWTTSDQGSAYVDKVNILIAADDIPDVLTLNVENQNAFSILRTLIDNELIMDLRETWDVYASDKLKEMHAIADNAALDAVTFDGKLYAIPGIADIESAIPYIWVRQDWLDALGMEGPTTIQDVAEISEAFMEQDPDGNGVDDTMGMLGSSDIITKDTNSFDWVWNAFDAYPGDWIEGPDGRVMYGSIAPEMKDALAQLNAWYEAGILDQEFALKDSGQSTEPVAANTAGVMQGAWWSAWWPLMSSVQNDPSAEWRPYLIQGVDGEYHYRSFPISKVMVVVNRDFEYPMAVMKVLNHYEDAQLIEPGWEWADELRKSTYPDVAVGLWPINSVAAKYVDEISRRAREVVGVMDGELGLDEVTTVGRSIAEQALRYEESREKGTADWAQWLNWGFGARRMLEIQPHQEIPVFVGDTDTLARQRAVLADLEKITFLEIIIGERPIDAFDEFVDQWLRLGGDQATEEVNTIMGR
jgi:putative aldouronate transport system substrate-binding protein